MAVVDDIKSVAKGLQNVIPNPFRDMITLVGGFTSLFLLQLIFKLNLVSYVGLSTLNQWELVAIVIVVAFAWGKFLNLGSEIILDILNAVIELAKIFILDTRSYKEKWTAFKIRWKTPQWKIRIAEILNPSYLRRGISYREVEHEITLIDTAITFNKYPSLAGRAERAIGDIIFLRIILLTMLIGGVLASRYYFLLVLVALYLLINTTRSINRDQYAIYRAVVKFDYEMRHQKEKE